MCKKVILMTAMLSAFFMCTSTVLLAVQKNTNKQKTFVIAGVVRELSIGNAVGSLVIKAKNNDEIDLKIYPNYKVYGAEDIKKGDNVIVKYITTNDNTIKGEVVSIKINRLTNKKGTKSRMTRHLLSSCNNIKCDGTLTQALY